MSQRRFHVTERRRVAENQRFDVLFDRLEGPDGAVVPAYLTVRPKVLVDGVSGVCVLPEVDGRIGLMRTWRHAFGEDVWQAPAGFAEPGEAIAPTAARELVEETGLTCPPERLRSLGLILPDAGIIEAKVALFVAHDAEPAGPDAAVIADEPGMGRLRFFDRDALAELLRDTAAMGAATMIACYRYLAIAR